MKSLSNVFSQSDLLFLLASLHANLNAQTVVLMFPVSVIWCDFFKAGILIKNLNKFS